MSGRTRRAPRRSGAHAPRRATGVLVLLVLTALLGGWILVPDARAGAPRSKGAAAAKGKGASTVPQAAAELISGPEVRDFRAFCDSWMGKLRDRTTYNTAHIAWQPKDNGVVGEHVSYAEDCTCIAREEPGNDPIGKITYRETRYRRQGVTPAEALAAPGTIVEQTDVTEIFRYAKGRWQY